MSQWGSKKARLVLAALLQIGWQIKRQSGGSHRVLSRPGWADYAFAFHDGEEIGPRMLARIARRTGLRPEDFREKRRTKRSSQQPPTLPFADVQRALAPDSLPTLRLRWLWVS